MIGMVSGAVQQFYPGLHLQKLLYLVTKGGPTLTLDVINYLFVFGKNRVLMALSSSTHPSML